MFTLFMSIYGGIDWEASYLPLTAIGILAVVLYLVFIIFALFCVLNVIIGIFCQNAIDTYINDTDNVIKAQLADKHKMVATLTEIFKGADEDENHWLTVEEFATRIENPKLRNLLRTLGVDTRDAIELFKMLDESGDGQIDLDEFISGCITLRGSAKAVHLERANLALFSVNQRLTELAPLAKSLKQAEGRLDSMLLRLER